MAEERIVKIDKEVLQPLIDLLDNFPHPSVRDYNEKNRKPSHPDMVFTNCFHNDLKTYEKNQEILKAVMDANPSVDSPEGHVERFGQYDHLRVFGRDSAKMLEAFGFEVTEIDGSRMVMEDSSPHRIKPVVGLADYDSNILYWARRW